MTESTRNNEDERPLTQTYLRSAPDETTTRAPPKSKRKLLQYLGPSLIVTAVTIGSGELIATTATGARLGFVVLWFLLLSLVVKIGLQYQIAKYCLITGKTPHEVIDTVPGKIFGHSWAWWWMVIFWVVVININFAGIFLGAGTLLYYLLGQTIPLAIVTLAVLVLTIVLPLRGYGFIENISTVFVAILSIATVIAAISTFITPYGASVNDFISGFSFSLPSGGLITLLGTVGITGIAANDLVAYAAMTRETGYERYAGPRDSDGWQERMIGWLKVMKIDVIASLLLIVVITIAFFTIGATVLAGFGEFPEGPRIAVHLANAYESIFGPIGYWLLLIGGFFALFSTVIVENRIISTMYSDWIHQTEEGSKYDTNVIITVAIIVLPIIWYLIGFITGIITPFIILAGVFFTITYIPEIIVTIWTIRQEQNEPEELRTTGITRIGVWISIVGTLLLVSSILILTLT